MATVSKEMPLTDVLDIDNALGSILMGHGMGCLGCPSSRGKSLEQAAMKHGVDVDSLVKEMNTYLESRSA